MKTFMSRYLKGDPVIWGVIIILSLFSVVAVFTSVDSLAVKTQGVNQTYYLLKHTGILLFGLFIIYITHLIPYKYYSRLSQLFFYISIPLLIYTLFKGANINQAVRWVTIPGTGLTFQSSDFAKLALIMFIARFLSKNQDNIKSFKQGFRPIIIPVLIICALILPANFSTAAILFTTALVLLFIGRVKLGYLLGLIGIGIIALLLFIIILQNSNVEGRLGTWKARIENFIGGDSESNYQAEQAKIAIVTGGLVGKGPGQSTQRSFLPHAYSDFIYAIIIEEYGLLVAIIILMLYLFLLYRAGVIVRKTNRTFPAFLAVGLTISLVFQAIVNMGVAVNLFPVTGQTLPLVSMGGTSIIFTSISFGIILSVSKSYKEEGGDEAGEETAEETSAKDEAAYQQIVTKPV